MKLRDVVWGLAILALCLVAFVRCDCASLFRVDWLRP